MAKSGRLTEVAVLGRRNIYENNHSILLEKIEIVFQPLNTNLKSCRMQQTLVLV